MPRKSPLAMLCRTSVVTKRVSRELSTWKFNFHREVRATSRDLSLPYALYLSVSFSCVRRPFFRGSYLARET